MIMTQFWRYQYVLQPYPWQSIAKSSMPVLYAKNQSLILLEVTPAGIIKKKYIKYWHKLICIYFWNRWWSLQVCWNRWKTGKHISICICNYNFQFFVQISVLRACELIEKLLIACISPPSCVERWATKCCCHWGQWGLTSLNFHQNFITFFFKKTFRSPWDVLQQLDPNMTVLRCSQWDLIGKPYK